MKSLLIIDDDEDMGDALLTYLSAEGYQVRFALSGKLGLALAQVEVPQVILLDWQMPQMGGQQVLTELDSIATLKSIPVILMSANVAEIPTESLNSRKHVRKPFNIKILISLIEECGVKLGPSWGNSPPS
jgi:DNA-binding response OmpR family regulator